MLSYWEKKHFLTYDVIIVGGGITGISTALSIKEKLPRADVLVLERGIFPSGASTKNAGFACFGSVTELWEDLQILGSAGMKELVEKRWSGLQLTRNRLGDAAIDLQLKGGFELIPEHEDHLEKINILNEHLFDLFDDAVFSLAEDELRHFQFHKVGTLIKNKFEGQLDTGKLMKEMWSLAQKKGVSILTGARVVSLDNKRVLLENDIAFEAKAVAICTNGFSRDLYSGDIDLSPGRGMVLRIVPASSLPFEGTFHYEGGYYYFRDFYGSLIFGGGRNLDYETESTTEFGINQKIKAKLINDLESMILPGQTYEVTDEWSGIMAFGADKSPIVKKTETGIYMGVRLGGMGVALGSKVGEDLSSLILASAF